jgi:hypothetical protein
MIAAFLDEAFVERSVRSVRQLDRREYAAFVADGCANASRR